MAGSSTHTSHTEHLPNISYTLSCFGCVALILEHSPLQYLILLYSTVLVYKPIINIFLTLYLYNLPLKCLFPSSQQD